MMLNFIPGSVFDAGKEFFQGSGFSDFSQQLTRSHFLTLVSLLLGGVVFFVIVFLRKRGQRGPLTTSPGDYSTGFPLDLVLHRKPVSGLNTKKNRPHEDLAKKKRREKDKEPANGQPPVSPESRASGNDGTQAPTALDKKQLKPKKKKRKIDIVEERLTKDIFPGKEKSEEEETGIWVTKISSREKRQLRRERMKQKETVSRSSPHPPVDEGSSLWSERADKETGWRAPLQGESPAGWGVPEAKLSAGLWQESLPQAVRKANRRPVEWVPPGKLEEDIFSHVGTWSMKAMKTKPVTFGTVSDFPSEFDNPDGATPQGSPSHSPRQAHMSSLGVDAAWLGLEDPFDADQTSDWNAPTEEWGNWCGETPPLVEPEIQPIMNRQGQGPGRRGMEEGSASAQGPQRPADGTEVKSPSGTPSADGISFNLDHTLVSQGKGCLKCSGCLRMSHCCFFKGYFLG
nr:PREDICTED: protein LYRIC-like isoform X2 [Lepisosteus oculatus]